MGRRGAGSGEGGRTNPWARLVRCALALSAAAAAASALPRAQEAPLEQEAPAQEEQAQQEQELEPIVVEIRVEGNRRYSTAQLVSALGQPVGEPRDREAIRRGIEALWNVFHVRAEVKERDVADELPDDGRGAIELLLQIEELALDLEPRFVGNVKVDTEEILEWAGLQEDAELFLYQAPRIRDRILQGYRRAGFHFAEVEVVDRPAGVDETTGQPVAPDVIFELEEGPKVRVREVVFHGNEALRNRGFWPFRRGLSKLAGVEQHGPRIFGFFASKFVRETLDADIIALREVYRDYGYLDAVVELARLEFSEDREWVTIHMAVDEGQPYTVGSVALEAVRIVQDEQGARLEPTELLFPEEELRALLDLQSGAVFRRNVVEDDRRDLRDRYGEDGYIDHESLPADDRWRFLDPLLTFEPDAPVVNVTYRVAQGRQQFIREIKVRGNLNTQDRVVRRLITVEPGDVADPAEIRSSRNRLQASGYFSNPRNPVDHREPSFRFVATDDANWKDLEFLVEEGEVLTFQASGGISSNVGAFGLFSVAHRNFDITRLPSAPWNLIDEVLDRQAFHGAGQELSLEASPGTESSYFRVFFREPDLFYRHKNRISLSLTAQRRLRRYESHDEEREDVGFRLGRQLGPDSSIFAGYQVGIVDVSDITTGGEPRLSNPLAVPATLRNQRGEHNIAHVETGYQLTTVDDRLDPHNGRAITYTLRVFDESVGSDFEFLKNELTWDYYDEFGEEDLDVGDRYHLGFDAGVATPYGDSDAVPYTERFFSGGQRNLRGFDLRGVGPNRKDTPRGGETYMHGTFEYRRPLVTTTQPGTYREIETIHGGFFFDVGILDEEDFQLDWSETRASFGILFGFGVPLPISFSFGFPLREGEGDDGQILGFSIGGAR